MDRVKQVVCPHCGAALKSGRGVRVGRHIPCPQCGVLFVVPEGGGVSGQTDAGRLILAVFGVVLYLAAGGALAGYCFALGAQKPDASPPQPPPVAQDDDGAGDDGPAAPRPAHKPTVTVDPALELKIDDAVVKGVWYLKEHQQADGAWGNALPAGQVVPVGYTALPGLALLESGVAGDDAVIQKAAKFVRQETPKLSPRSNYDTYEAALAILFLDRLGGPSPEDNALIQLEALRLIAGQRADDWGWAYQNPDLDPKQVPELIKQLRDEKVPLDTWRQAALKGKPFDPGPSNNSTTQFAVLGLWVAGRHGVPIHKSIDLVEKRFRMTQLTAGPDPGGHMLNLEGAWPYSPGAGTSSSPWPTMTAAGLLGLAVAHGATIDPAKQKQNPLNDDAVKGGLAMLGREIDRPDEKTANRALDLYFLWSVERVAVLYNLARIENKDWYGWGSKELLARQQADGHWQAGAYYDNNAIHDTCFALLFLKQANLAQDLTDKFQLLEKK
jgi:hypothetical protein